MKPSTLIIVITLIGWLGAFILIGDSPYFIGGVSAFTVFQIVLYREARREELK